MGFKVFRVKFDSFECPVVMIMSLFVNFNHV